MATARISSHHRPISDDPLIDRLHRSAPEVFLIAYLCFLVYCSLLPFGQGGAAAQSRSDLDWSSLTNRSAGLKDILPNILLYVPLAASAYVVGRRHGWGRTSTLLVACAIGAGTSALLELLQQWVPLRVSSWVDVVSNVAGGALGAVLGPTCRRIAHAMFRAARFELRHLPLSTVARAFAVVVFVAGLVPLDFTYDASRISQAIGQVNLVPFGQVGHWQAEAERARLSGDMPGYAILQRCRVDFCLDVVAEAAAFGVLGLLVVMSLRREHRAGKLESWSLATGSAAVAALGLSFLQLFIMSRGFDATDVVVRTAGAFVGAAFAALFTSGSPRALRPVGLPELPSASRRFAGLVCAGVVVYVFCRGFSPFLILESVRTPGGLWDEVALIPMAGYFHMRISASVDDVTYKVLRYAVFGVTAALALGLSTSRPHAGRVWRIALAGMGISTIIELCQIHLPTRFPDLTHVLLAGFGSGGGAIAIRWGRDYACAGRERWLAAVDVPTEHPSRPEAATVVMNVEPPAPDVAAPDQADGTPQPAEHAEPDGP